MTKEVKNAQKQKTATSPLLSVRRGQQAIEFYQTAFGAEELFRVQSEDGAVVARLSVGGAKFWLADESPEHANWCSPQKPRWFGRSAINTAGARGALSIPSDTTGRLVNL